MTFKGSGEPVPVAKHHHSYWWFLIVLLGVDLLRFKWRLEAVEEQVVALRADVVRLEAQVRELSAPREEQ